MTDAASERRPRVALLDIGRGLALLAMASYHFTWDLSAFGYIDASTPETGGWKIYARCIATTFLFLVGVSLVLAHGLSVRWRGFWRRWIAIAASAAAITLLTWLAIRFGYLSDGLIFFGILHEIAFASLAGLLFLRLPPIAAGVAALFCIAMPHVARADLFNHWPLLWVGLATALPRSNDYVPVFPWFAPVLAGIAAARLADREGLFVRLARIGPGPWSLPLRFIGRHSLAFYLIHQPVLIGCVFLASLITPPSTARHYAGLRQACETRCGTVRDEEFCARYCVCVLDRLEAEGHLAQSFPANDAERASLANTTAQCSADASLPGPGEQAP